MRMMDLEGIYRTCQQQEEKDEHHMEALGANRAALNSLADSSALALILKACATQKDLNKGSQLHADIIKRGLLANNILVGNSLVSMYSKCGALAKAQYVFGELFLRDVVSWSAMIAAYARRGWGEEALNCWVLMKHEGISPAAATFVSILKACGSIGAVEKGKEIHIEVVRKKFLQNGITTVGNALVDMYAKCNDLAKAHQVFEHLSIRNIITWNALITGYCQHGFYEEALTCFEQMKCEGLPPSAVTFACIFKAFGSMRAMVKGKQTHATISSEGYLGKDMVLGNALVGMYARCGAFEKVGVIFDALLVRDVVSFNALMEGYYQHGRCEEALECLTRMKDEGLSPDLVSFACLLKACGGVRAAEKGERVHAEIVSKGLQGVQVLGNALVDMYAKYGMLAMAQQVFNELPLRCVVSWTALIAGYSQHGHDEQALHLYLKMRQEGLLPDAVVSSCVLKACGNLGAAQMGEEVHVEIIRKELLEHNIVLGSVLVDMYAKCGMLARAQDVFEEVSARSVVSWTTLIAGYCENGDHKKALCVFERMKLEGLHPDVVTISCILKACGSVGAACTGQFYYDNMSTTYGIIPTSRHQTSMVDLYSRVGLFDKAMAVIWKMPSKELPAWFAVMSACSKWGNVNLGKVCFELVKQVND
ncbi:hypothetical protein GOP47_0030383 [Adiantum capillus-veneris]|nr:hypothetical protein GOP47_0030383 [Adiantum capillus-veneris]